MQRLLISDKLYIAKPEVPCKAVLSRTSDQHCAKRLPKIERFRDDPCGPPAAFWALLSIFARTITNILSVISFERAHRLTEH